MGRLASTLLIAIALSFTVKHFDCTMNTHGYWKLSCIQYLLFEGNSSSTDGEVITNTYYLL